MSGISPIQALSPAETWEAWQAVLQASTGEMAGAEAAAQPGAEMGAHAVADVATATAAATATAPEPTARAFMPAHATVHAAQAAQPTAQPAADAVQPPAQPPAPSLLRSHESAQNASPLQPPSTGLPTDLSLRTPQLGDASAAVLPMAPVLMTPLALQNGAELRWRVQDAPAWRALFDDAGRDAPHADEDDEAPARHAAPSPDDAAHEPPPPWAQALLARLRLAAAAPASADHLRPALQAWRVGAPVLLASPAGLASLQASGDAGLWRWRRWPARWRSVRPAVAERWWAVRVALTPSGCPRTLRELSGEAALQPGQVSCELRLDGTAPGIARWAEVLVQAPAHAGLQALLASRPSLTWLLCNQPLWPRESA